MCAATFGKELAAVRTVRVGVGSCLLFFVVAFGVALFLLRSAVNRPVGALCVSTGVIAAGRMFWQEMVGVLLPGRVVQDVPVKAIVFALFAGSALCGLLMTVFVVTYFDKPSNDKPMLAVFVAAGCLLVGYGVGSLYGAAAPLGCVLARWTLSRFVFRKA